jgi:hypothetical protein
MGVRQWIREVEVILGSGGVGLSIKDLRVQFEVEKTVESAPNEAKIKIFNLTPEHEAQIKEEFDEVILNAGYKDNIGMIFRGNIQHVYRYRNKTDTITEIVASDGDKDYRLATINTTFAAGSTNLDIIDAAIDSFQGVGDTNRGTIAVPGKVYLRGKVVTSNSRAALDNVSKECGVNWSIQNGELDMIGVDDFLPDVVVINKETGMLGSPTVTDKGVEVRCLMNNLLKVNARIELDRSTINEKKNGKGADKKGQAGKRKSQPDGSERVDETGLYKILNLKHKGDNRAPEWVSTSVCLFLE